MREAAYLQKNNNSHTYTLINENQGIDLMPFLYKRELSWTKFETTVDGKFASNSLSFTLKLPYHTKEVLVKTGRVIYIDAEILKSVSIDDERLEGVSVSDTLEIEGYIPLSCLIKEDNSLFLEDENNMIFKGVVDSITKKREKTALYINVSVKDETYYLYEKTYTANYLFRDIYLCNNNDTDNSLLHRLAYLLGFEDNKLNLEDVIGHDDEYLVIPYVYLQEDDLIISDFAAAVRLTNSVYNIVGDKLTVKLSRTVETYVFDKRNILSNIETSTVRSDYEKLKITYDKYFKKTEQDMWILVGEGGTVDDANIRVVVGNTRKFQITWFHNVDIVDEYKIYDVRFEDVEGNEIDFDYTLELSETGGTLELANSSESDVYVKSFKIKGIPLFMQSDNISYYPAEVDSENILELTNKFIQNEVLAKYYQHLTYLDNCRDYESIKFTSNVANFLQTGVKIYLDHEDYIGWAIIEKISFSNNRMQIEAREDLPDIDIQSIYAVEKTYADEYEILSTSYLEDNGLYESDKPATPQNWELVAEFLGFKIQIEESSSNLRGYWIYYKRADDTDFSRMFSNSNNYYYQTAERVYWDIKVSAVSVNGVEGDCTEIKQVIPLKLGDTSVDVISAINVSDEEITISAQRITLGDALIAEGDSIGIANLEAKHFKGEKIEGLQFISENTDQTERVRINSGEVVREKRLTTSDDYQSYESLTLIESGEIRCQNDWSDNLDLKEFNNNLPWSNFKIISFISAQYDLNSGEAVSREIIKENVGSIDDQIVKFKVSGGAWSNTAADINNYDWVDNQIVITSVSELNISYNILSKVYKLEHPDDYGYYSESVRLYLKIDNESETLIDSLNAADTFIDKDSSVNPIIGISGIVTNSFSVPVTITLRREFLSDWSTTGTANTRIIHQERTTTLSGDITKSSFNEDYCYDCTVNYIVVGQT